VHSGGAQDTADPLRCSNHAHCWQLERKYCSTSKASVTPVLLFCIEFLGLALPALLGSGPCKACDQVLGESAQQLRLCSFLFCLVLRQGRVQRGCSGPEDTEVYTPTNKT
jgi:hypothetical protein